jgi:hypothetical protein
MLRTKPLKLGETGVWCLDVKFALECEMLELMLDLEQFKHEERIERPCSTSVFAISRTFT